MNNIIFSTHAPGLGDHLQYSTLPEEFSKLGKDFYLHKNCLYRNKEIYELIWKLNPYVKGFSEEPPNAGEEHFCNNKIVPSNSNYIHFIESRNGITSNNKFPKIYYKPKLIPELQNVCLIDMGSIGAVQQGAYINKVNSLKEYFLKIINNDSTTKYINVNKTNSNNHTFFSPVNEFYNIESLFHYCDAIFSCKKIICAFSGILALSSAIKEKNNKSGIEVISGTEHLNYHLKYGFWIFDNITYTGI